MKKPTKKISFYLESDFEKSAQVVTISEYLGKDLTFGELSEGYYDTSEKVDGGVFGWNGRLDIRPDYQRNYIRSGNSPEAVNWRTKLIHTVINGKPMGNMYFFFREDGTAEQVDGQQRMMTVLEYIDNKYPLKFRSKNGVETEFFFDNLKRAYPDIARRILEYKPQIYVCCGDNAAKHDWFRTINEPNSPLRDQEIRNASYVIGDSGFVKDLKKHFAQVTSKPSSLTEDNIDFLGNRHSKYLYTRYFGKREPVRQDVVENILDWVSLRDYIDEPEITKSDRIDMYMEKHQNDGNADDAISYYKTVVDWMNDVFFHGTVAEPADHMPSHQWSRLYIEYHDKPLTEEEKEHITRRCRELVEFLKSEHKSSYKKVDKIRQRVYGVYEWVLNGENPEDFRDYMEYRAFQPEDKVEMYAMQGGIDPIDGKHYEIGEMESHHIVPWYDCGHTNERNHVLLYRENHRRLDQGGPSPEQLMRMKEELIRKVSSHETYEVMR